jgi:Zn-finger nucleic acid-binding protein
MHPGLPNTQLCPQCEGCWVAKGNLVPITTMAYEDLVKSPLQPTLVADKEVALEAPLNCPECGQPMGRKIYCSDSGVLVDRCAQHGTWFDDGELGQSVDYVQERKPS